MALTTVGCAEKPLSYAIARSGAGIKMTTVHRWRGISQEARGTTPSKAARRPCSASSSKGSSTTRKAATSPKGARRRSRVFSTLTHEGAGKALAAALKENQTLQSSTLDCEGHMGDETGDETVKALAAALKENQALQSFTLNSGGCMGDETGKALAAALKENLTLQSFTLTVHKCVCK